MRILMTTDTVGGVWNFTKQLTTDLILRGHKVALISFGREPSASQAEWFQSTASNCADFWYTSSSCPLEWMQNNNHVYQLGASLLLSAAEHFQPDVLLSNQFCYGKLPLPIPRVVVAHSDVLSWARACRSTALPSSPWLTQYTQLVSDGLDSATAVVAPTHWMLTALAASFTLPQHAVVILNGRTLPPTPSPEAPRTLQAVTAGRLWDEGKNLRILENLQAPFPILVAGGVESEASRVALHHSCVGYLGELSEQEIVSLFHRSAIYVCTSAYEPFGLAPLEAALCGCAVLANDIPSLREVWAECAGFFHDDATLASALQRLTDPVLLEAARARSQQRAKIFTSSRMTERYLNLFERLLSVSPTGRSSYAA